jgi:hypothetical protein
MSRIAVLQFGSGKHASMLDASQDTHKQLCYRYGYQYIQEREPRMVHPIWEKARMIRSALSDGYDVVWLDADTLWMQGDVGDPIREFDGFSLTHHHYDDYGPHYNAGVMFVRNSIASLQIINEWIASPIKDEIWIDQAALLELSKKYPEMFRRIGHEWNSVEWLPRYQHPNPNIVAWHGKPDLALTRIPEYVRLRIQSESGHGQKTH